MPTSWDGVMKVYRQKFNFSLLEMSVKRAKPGTDIFLFASFACENWCCHVRSQYNELFSRYSKKIISNTIVGTVS